MKQNLSIKGYWFLPDDPDNRVGGTLHYLPNKRMYLELTGAFEAPMEYLKSSADNDLNRQPVIFGETENAREITLFHCYQYGSYNFDSSFAMTSYTVQLMIEGMHLADLGKKTFHSICTSFPLLTQWVNHYPMKHSISFKKERMVGFDMGYDTEDHHCITTPIAGGMSMDISYWCTGPDDSHNEEIRIRQGYTLELKSPTVRSIANLRDAVYRFKSFLSMASQTQVDFNEINLYSKKIYHELSNKQKIQKPIKLYFIQQPIHEIKSKRFRGFLFRHEDVANEFPAIVNTWYSFDAQMLPIINHLVESIRVKRTFKSGDFLLVVQALEGFHTRFRKIATATSKNRPTLSDRLNALKKEFAYVPVIKKQKLDMRSVADTRNYYSHFFLKKANKKVAQGQRLYDMTDALKKLLICCVMAETGVCTLVIAKSFDK